MYRHCTQCGEDIDLAAWQGHLDMHKRTSSTYRNGKGASQKQKQKVRRRQGYRCIRCEQPSSSLQVHHVDGNWRNNKMANLVAACPDCHRILDAEVRAAR